jgi:predicted SnoaL-like aldol condensation-catalyzing enzyme
MLQRLAMLKENTSLSPTPGLNRDTVLAFYRLGLQDKQPTQAFARFMASDFIEHKPDVSDPTREGSAAFLEKLMLELPAATWEVVRTIAEYDLVFLHARFVPTPGAPAYAIADVFRLQDGLIVEHWDVVAGPSVSPKNPYSRFESAYGAARSDA